MPVSPHCPHILQRRLQRLVTRSWTNVGIGRLSGRGSERWAITSLRPRLMRPRWRRAKPASCRPRRKLMGTLPPRVEIDHAHNRSLAHRAERHVVAREHDAVFLRAVIALPFVHRSLEGADLAGIFVGGEKLLVRLL